MRKTFFLLSVILSQFFYGDAQNIPNGQLTPAPPTATLNPLPSEYSPSVSVSYTTVWDVRMPAIGISQVLQSTQLREVNQTTEYTDGMSRPLQTVKRGVTPTGKDLIFPRTYDNVGRESIKYLSYPSSTSDGKMRLNAFAEQATYLQTQSQYSGEQVFYSKTVFDNSPLGNVEKTMTPGNSWAGSNRGETIKYEVNGTNEVKLWTVAAGINSIPLASGFYDPSTLYRGTITDVNGKRTVSYKDKEGRIILKKVEIKNDGAAVITDYLGWLCTYYVYDDVSNLRYTITPRAVEWLVDNSWAAISTTILNSLCFRYEYDDKSRLIITKSPGAEEVCTIYDAKDRVVLFRDGNLHIAGKWQYTFYDEMNRVVEKGLWNNTQTRDDHQLQAENSINYPVITIGNEVLEQIFYDNYSFLSSCGCNISSTFDATQLTGSWMNTTPSNQYPFTQQLTQSQQLLDLITIKKTKILNSSPAAFLYTVLFYDSEGNVIQTVSTNSTVGKDIITTQYGFGGRVLASHVQHNFNGASITQTQNIFSRVEYDDAGRILKTYKRINSEVEKIQNSNTYNEESQLTKLELGLLAGTPLATINYLYNLDGSIKAMNESFVKGTTNQGFFGEIISRDYGFSQASYNSNIAGVQWRSIGDGERRAFGYSYDPANRLLKGDFTQYSGGWNTAANVDFSVNMGDGVNPTTAYDANGNIKSMSQKALKLYQSDVVDNLSYQYENSNYSNRLFSVSDAATEGTQTNVTGNILGDFKDNITGSPSYDYLYDANGNTIQDNNKAIASITYNHLNKPTVVQITGKGTITYVYDATGEKLQKIITPVSGPVVKYSYISGFTYKEEQLLFYYTEQGRIRPTVSLTGVAGWANDFFLKDHLGNIRMILSDEVRTDIYARATLEDATIANEAVYYDKTNVGLTARPGAFGTTTTNGQKVQLLQKNTQAIGVGKLLRVMAMDKISVSVDYYFPAQTVDNSGANGLGSLVSVITSLFNSTGAPSVFLGKGGDISQQLNSSSPLNTLLAPQNTSNASTSPKAYLNILFFDEQFRFISQSSQFIGVTVSGSLLSLNRTGIEAPKNGYMYAYVSNESNNLVYFDNFQVSHTRAPILEENHYNSFGAKLTGLCSRAMPGVANSLGYQSKQLDEDFDLDWYDFDARCYDPQIGRFLQQDPADQFASGYVGMGNNWVTGVDPDGKWLQFVIGAVVGAIVNVVGNLDNIHSIKDAFAYAGVGAISGVVAATGNFAAAGAITGLGNAYLGGVKDAGELIKQGIIGSVSGAIGGAAGGKLNSVISAPLSNAIGSKASIVVGNIATSAIVGGAFGAGFSAANGQNVWQGFLSGMRNGAISGTISTLVPMGINKFAAPKAPTPPVEEPQLKPVVTQAEPIKTEIKVPSLKSVANVKSIPDKISPRQIQHKLVGTKNGQVIGKSILYANENALLEGIYSEKYKVIRVISESKYVVDFGHAIGTFYNNGKYVGPSRYGIVNFGPKAGTHIYPANPKQN